ncbi:MAG TPA: nucleotidyltransferase family protein [Casimicrobiaceae bacterium]|nr:nucleotidyltransferase family protein [Casimicrobiaceae bacterium]
MIGGGWQPTPAQEDLLEAAVGTAARAPAAWRSWRARLGHLGPDAIDGGSAQILPLLKPRLALLPPDDPLLPMIGGCYRRSLYHGRMLRARAATLLVLLTHAGIATMVSKGGVLGTAYYGDLGLRPMNDFDVLVPRAQALDAVRVLLDAGWVSTQPLAEMLPDAYHSACFQSPDRLDFDLHWHLLPEACFGDADAPAWGAAEPYMVDDAATQAPCATDLLVIVCAHAAHWAPVSPARWVADALVILRRAPERIDWTRIAMLAQRWHVVPHLSDTLSYLAQRWGAGIPRPLLSELQHASVGRIDRRTYALLGRMPGRLTYLGRPWFRYRLRTRDRSGLTALPGFTDYLKITLGVANGRALIGEIFRRYRRWRADRARGER